MTPPPDSAADVQTIEPALPDTPGPARGTSRFAAQRAALDQLMGLASQCAADYEQLEQSRAGALAVAADEFARARAVLSAQVAARRARVDDEAEVAIAEHARVYEEAAASADWERAGKQGELDQKQRRTDKQLNKDHSDGVWLVDTMLEGETARIEEAGKAVRKLVTADAERLEALRVQAAALAVRFQQSLPPTEGDVPYDGPSAGDASALEGALAERRTTVEAALAAMRRQVLPRLFTGPAPWVLAIVLVLIGAAAGHALSVERERTFARLLQAPPNWRNIGIAAAMAAVVVVGLGWWLRRLAVHQVRTAGHRFAEALARAKSGARADRNAMTGALDEQLIAATVRHEADTRGAHAKNDRHRRAARQNYDALKAEIDAAADRAEAQAASARNANAAAAESIRAAGLAQLMSWHDAELRVLQHARAATVATAERVYQEGQADLVHRWERALSITRDMADDNDRPEFAAIRDWRGWRPPRAFAPTVRFGELAVDVRQFTGGVRQTSDGVAVIGGGGDGGGGGSNGEGLRLPIPDPYAVPALLGFPDHANLLIKHEPAGRDAAVATLRLTMLRLLTSLPPGRVQFTLIDPVGLGRSFAGFMHLADFDDDLVGGRVWTDADAIEQRLTDLTEHMETVIQKYLRNEFETIDAYNAQAGELAEPYRFVVIADLPTAFSEKALARLASIAASGTRCGVHVLAALDTRQVGRGSATFLEDLERNCNTLLHERSGGESGARGAFRWQDATYGRLPLTLDTPPEESALTDVMRVLGQAARDAKRVEVPFESIMPRADEVWSLDSAADLHVPVGRTGATRLQTFRLGRGVAQHALIAGKTGSGKSTLLNVLITNLSLWYAPDQLELYLIDFKRGVEFKAYATGRLPHARAVAIESDREFGLSVLGRLDEELGRRGELFRAAGVQDLAAYRKWAGKVTERRTNETTKGPEPENSAAASASASDPSVASATLPRVLLVVDEFQELFSEDDKLTQDAALLIDRLVRQGRAFGIHVILGSQTIGGQTGLGRATLGQMAVRVALQCAETDSQLILGDNNAAARLLSRPGEAIYNDAGGSVESNSPFQVSWLDDEHRDALIREVRERAERAAFNTRPTVVFEGNAAADLRDNAELRAALAGRPARRNAIYLGDPVAIKEPTHVGLRRQAGANVLVVGQQEEGVLAVIASAMIGLTATANTDNTGRRLRPRFVLLDGTPADAPRAGYLADVARRLPCDVDVVSYRAVPDALTDLAAELRERLDTGAPGAPPIVLVVHGVQRYRSLTRGDDFAFAAPPSPFSAGTASGGSSFADILEKGDADADPAVPAPPTAATVPPTQALIDLLRDGPLVGIHVLLTADTLAGLERRLGRDVLREFDARVLFQMSGNDSSVLLDSLAAGRLGHYRALVASEEQGTVEKFRPYAPPSTALVEEVARSLQ